MCAIRWVGLKGEIACPSAGRHRFFAAIIVEAALRLPPEPARLDIFHEQRTRTVLGVGKSLIEYLHDRQAGVEANEVGKLQRAHRMVSAEPHRRIDGID